MDMSKRIDLSYRGLSFLIPNQIPKVSDWGMICRAKNGWSCAPRLAIYIAQRCLCVQRRIIGLKKD